MIFDTFPDVAGGSERDILSKNSLVYMQTVYLITQ